MRRAAVAALVATLGIATGARPAHADPTTGELVVGGLGMAIPAYFAGVAWHEGSHALWATIFGARVYEYDILPSVRAGHLYFGYTRWHGDLSSGRLAWTLMAPKLTDALLLGGFATLVLTDELPHNHWGALAVNVLASAAWIDFSLDVLATHKGNDMVRAYKLLGDDGVWASLPWRVLHASIAIGFGITLAIGYKRLFDPDAELAAPAFVLPLFVTHF